MILVLGANSYIGRAFAGHLRARGKSYIPLSLAAFDYSNFELLFDYLRKIQPEFVINAPSVETATVNDPVPEQTRADAVKSNMLLPQTVGRACLMTNTGWGHVSSANIFCGAKVWENGNLRVERDEEGSWLLQMLKQHPERIFGFTELDVPNYAYHGFQTDFHRSTKALAEEALKGQEQTYIWRLHLPFNQREDPSNWLARLQRTTPGGGVHTVSHLDDFVMACLELWTRQAPFGVYNVVNPGVVSTTEVLQMIQRILRPEAKLSCVEDVDALDGHGNEHSCVLDGTKLRRAGIQLRNAKDALQDALERWESASSLREQFKGDTDFLSLPERPLLAE